MTDVDEVFLILSALEQVRLQSTARNAVLNVTG